MTTELRWIANLSTSGLHAADAWLHGKTLTDARLATVVPDLASRLNNAIQSASLPEPQFWRHLLALAHQHDNNRELASLAIRKTVRWQPQYESAAAAVADSIGALEDGVRQAVPGAIDELDLRSRPLRELWEARGPGLLHFVRQSTDNRLIVDQAEVVLVLPAMGGGGAAHLVNNSVRIEALLTNNLPQLPEIARLGWLLAQLNSDLPVFSEAVPADRVHVLAQLAFVPPVLQAAQAVELTEFNLHTTEAAITGWHLEVPPDTRVAETLLVWWQTYQGSRPEWETAIAALNQMIFP